MLGISGSPRLQGNSDILLSKALAGAQSAGASIESIALRDLQITPCQECNACQRSGQCPIEDDFPNILGKLLECDRLIIATPIFFMSVTAYVKALIERCQCVWARKYVLKQPLFAEGARDRRAMLISVAATRSEQMFDCVTLTMKYWLDVLEMKQVSSLFVNQVDGNGDILKHPFALDEAFRLGQRLVTDPLPPDKPAVVKLFGGLPNETVLSGEGSL